MKNPEENLVGITRAKDADYRFEGFFDEYLRAISDNWLKVAWRRNPAMLEMFADRQRKPHPNLLPWSGEFAGKYLTSSVQVLRLTRDKELADHLRNFVDQLMALQADDGYLGPWPPPHQLTGTAPDNSPANTWDAWNHYHIMIGLLLWYEDTGDAKALHAVERIGDLLCAKFLGKPGSLNAIGESDKNFAPAHALCLLYRAAKKQQYLDLARQIIVDEFPLQGNWFELALQGREFYQSPLPRWESLHALMALAEMYRITGEHRYRQAFEHLWWSIVKTDRHNTGGFSTIEKALGNPYAQGPIETCCTIAWTAMTVEMLRLTANSIVADELELTLLNATLAAQSRSGQWSTYDTPMDGVRRASTTEIPFQKRPGSEELNCCSVNAARGFGMVSDWALMEDHQGLILNWYGRSTLRTKVKNIDVVLQQETQYPRVGTIELHVSPATALEFTLKLRIPHWSAKTHVGVNDKMLNNEPPGKYLTLSRKWNPGDTVTIELDMSLHYWLGEKECQEKCSIYRGPILLAYNPPGREEIVFDNRWQPNGSLHFSNEIGAKLTYAFQGDSIRWLGLKYPDAGQAQVKIDGQLVATVDQYAPQRETAFLWEHHGLGAGSHTIELTVTGKNENSSDTRINLLKFLQEPPTFDARLIAAPSPDPPAGSTPIISLQIPDVNGNRQVLLDFDSAGRDGVPYLTWLNVLNAPQTPFSPSNPLRSDRG